MKLKLAEFKIFCSKVLSLWCLNLVGCQPLLSDRHQIDKIGLTLWQGVNHLPNQNTLIGLVEAISLFQCWRNLMTSLKFSHNTT